MAWQPNHLKHYKQIWRVWWYRPIPVLISLHQVRIYSPFLPRRDEPFRQIRCMSFPREALEINSNERGHRRDAIVAR